MHEIRDRGIRAVTEHALAAVGDGPAFLSVDIDVLNPRSRPAPARPSRAA